MQHPKCRILTRRVLGLGFHFSSCLSLLWASDACCGRGLDSSLHTPSHPPLVRKSLPLSTLLALSWIIFIIPFDFSYMFSRIFSRKLGMPPAVSLQAFCVSVVVERNLYTRLFSFLCGLANLFAVSR